MKAVLLDLDGVLIDSYRVWHAVISAFARDHGYPEISDELMKQRNKGDRHL
jgi:beta-phosphoglucomutase-like phosphatase (HAD superfamily)